MTNELLSVSEHFEDLTLGTTVRLERGLKTFFKK